MFLVWSRSTFCVWYCFNYRESGKTGKLERNNEEARTQKRNAGWRTEKQERRQKREPESGNEKAGTQNQESGEVSKASEKEKNELE